MSGADSAKAQQYDWMRSYVGELIVDAAMVARTALQPQSGSADATLRRQLSSRSRMVQSFLPRNELIQSVAAPAGLSRTEHAADALDAAAQLYRALHCHGRPETIADAAVDLWSAYLGMGVCVGIDLHTGRDLPAKGGEA